NYNNLLHKQRITHGANSISNVGSRRVCKCQPVTSGKQKKEHHKAASLARCWRIFICTKCLIVGCKNIFHKIRSNVMPTTLCVIVEQSGKRSSCSVRFHSECNALI